MPYLTIIAQNVHAKYGLEPGQRVLCPPVSPTVLIGDLQTSNLCKILELFMLMQKERPL